MIQITKQEAMYIREQLPKIYIARTKHKYYAPETIDVMRLLPYNAAAQRFVEAYEARQASYKVKREREREWRENRKGYDRKKAQVTNSD